MVIRNREAAGFLLSSLFVCLAALRDVYFGGLFQRVHPLVVAVVAFALCPLVFLPMALFRDRAGLTALLRRPRELLWINATTALAWLSFFHALRLAEPAIVQVIFFGIGPLSVRWLDRLVPGAAASTPTPGERRLHLGLLAALGLAAAVMLGGWSGRAAAARPGRRGAGADSRRWPGDFAEHAALPRGQRRRRAPGGRHRAALCPGRGGRRRAGDRGRRHAGRGDARAGARRGARLAGADRAAELREPDRHRAGLAADGARGPRRRAGAGVPPRDA